MRRSRSIVLALVTALAATVGAAWVPLPAFAAGATATFVKTADWGTGWEGKYTITNGGSAALPGWTVALSLPAGTFVSNYKEALLFNSGQRYAFTNRSWNGNLAPGASVSFGFVVVGSGSPTNCLLNGAPCGDGPTPTATPGAVTFGIDPGLSASLGGYTDADFTTDVRTLRSRGKKVILSVGGETGRVAVNAAASATAFADTAHTLIQRYGFDGVDIDLENGLNPTYLA